MPLSRRVARFNRLVANRFVGPVLTRMPGFGTVNHRGRRSGRPYETPVKVFVRGEDYVIALPYGPGSDWVRNVLAAGGCDLTVRGRRVRLLPPHGPPLQGEEHESDGQRGARRSHEAAAVHRHATSVSEAAPAAPSDT